MSLNIYGYHVALYSIEWAREKFDDLFVNGADLANSFIENQSAFFSKLKQDPLTEIDSLKTVNSWLELSSHPSFELCVQVLLNDFIANFRDAINDLTHHFPRDARIIEKETGADLGPFWHGHKRFPQAATFDPNDENHLNYIYHGANILASVFGLKEQDKTTVRGIAQRLQQNIKPWEYTGQTIDLSGQEEGKDKIETTTTMINIESNSSNNNSDYNHTINPHEEEDAAIVHRLTSRLSSINVSHLSHLHPAEFEKV